MMGGGETVSGDQDGLHTTAVHVPIGWQRRVEGGRVVYVSPSGTSLSSLDEVKTYLLTDGTCKCGLECPLVIHKVFNFALGVKVEQSSLPVGKAEQDMTKLCNHRRKVVAMAALCRSMQASQLPFSSLHHPEVSRGVDNRHPKRLHGERGEDHPKLHPAPQRAHNACVSPQSPRHFIYPQNGSSPVLHSSNNPYHPLDSARRLHHPPLCSVSTQSFPGYRSPRTPTPHSTCPGQRTPKTPDTPGSPRFGPLSSPPPSSPMPLAGVRAAQNHLTPLSSPPSRNCVSPQQRSRHPSASPSSLPEHGEAAGRRKSTSSSSPHSPLPCGSPSSNPHLPKYKLEDILEQFKHSGSANNHQFPFPISPALLNNQSHDAVSQKTTHSRVPCPTGCGLNSTGPSNSHVPFVHHHSLNRMPHPSTFPASSLLSAAAKAQLVNQVSQGSPSVSVDSSLEVFKEAQQHKSKVTNSTLHHSHAPPSSPSTACPGPQPSLLHPSHSLAQPPASLPQATERGASHRKRQRRSPTVLNMVRGAQQLLSGPRMAPTESAHTAINLTTPRSSTSALLNHNLPLEKQLLPGQTRLPAPHPAALCRTKGQSEALDFTTGSPLTLDPPTQPLSALLHLLSVQNAQNASASADGSGDTKNMNKPTFPSPYTKQNSNTNPALCNVPVCHSQPALTESSAQHRLSPPGQSKCTSQPRSSPSPRSTSALSFSQSPLQDSAAHINANGSSLSDMSQCPSTSPKPLDLSTHVLALLAASSAPAAQGDTPLTAANMSSQQNHCTGAEEPVCLDPKESPVTKSTGSTSPAPVPAPSQAGSSPQTPSAVGDSGPLPLAEAFPFMNQEQLLQLLSSGSLPSLLDPTVLASLPLGGLWLGGQQGQLGPTNTPPQALPSLSEQQPEQLLLQPQDSPNQDQHKQMNPLFPLLPLLSTAQGELPMNLLGLVNPIPPAASPTSIPGQDGDLALSDKAGLQALLMASLLLGQQQAPLLPLSGLGQVSLEVPLQQPALDSLSLDKPPGLMDPSGLLELPQGLLPLSAGSEGQLLLPPPTTFLPLSPALLSAALSSAELHSPPNPQIGPAQQTQQTPPQTQADGMDTLIPLPLQSKDNPILQQLLPTLLNPTVLGDLSNITGLQNLVGLGAGSILLPPVQASALGMPLLQGPDGTINLLNNLQLSIATSPEEEKPVSTETESPAPQEDIPANQTAAEGQTPEVPSPTVPHKPAGTKPVIDPYTSFMDTIYTSFLQVSAREQEEGARSSPFCALPPVSFPLETLSPPTPPLPQACAPVSLSPRRACSLRNPDLSRLSLEAAAHSPAQGTPKPTEDGHRKTVPPIYLEEAQTDCTQPAAVCPYTDTRERKRLLPPVGYLRPGDTCSEDTPGTMLLDQHASDAVGGLGEARRGRKRKQLLQNVLEDFRDLDAAAALDESKATAALLKSDRSVRGRRRRGARSQRQ